MCGDAALLAGWGMLNADEMLSTINPDGITDTQPRSRPCRRVDMSHKKSQSETMALTTLSVGVRAGRLVRIAAFFWEFTREL